jgi:hypothetical protein
MENNLRFPSTMDGIMSSGRRDVANEEPAQATVSVAGGHSDSPSTSSQAVPSRWELGDMARSSDEGASSESMRMPPKSWASLLKSRPKPPMVGGSIAGSTEIQ